MFGNAPFLGQVRLVPQGLGQGHTEQPNNPEVMFVWHCASKYGHTATLYSQDTADMLVSRGWSCYKKENPGYRPRRKYPITYPFPGDFEQSPPPPPAPSYGKDFIGPIPPTPTRSGRLTPGTTSESSYAPVPSQDLRRQQEAQRYQNLQAQGMTPDSLYSWNKGATPMATQGARPTIPTLPFGGVFGQSAAAAPLTATTASSYGNYAGT